MASAAIAPPGLTQKPRHTPITATVLCFDVQAQPYKLPAPQRLQVVYGTPTTVRLNPPATHERLQKPSLRHEYCYCVSDDAAWQHIVDIHAALDAALAALADGLRGLGTYAARLAEAGGVVKHPDPLSPTVIRAMEPDEAGYGYYAGYVPTANRDQVLHHTPKMIAVVSHYSSGESRSHQRGHFVCPSDADWERIQALHRTATKAKTAFEQALKELGTYAQAISDGRYAGRAAPAAATSTAPAPSAAPATPTMLPLDMLRTDGGTQARAMIDHDTMLAYTDALIDDVTLPPVVVFYDGSTYWLGDGFHRAEAHRRARRVTIDADVRQGTRRDAVLFAAGANAEHGLRRTRADVRRAIEVLLRDSEWSQLSDREIARHCHCDHKTVGVVRKELADSGEVPQSTERTGADGRTINTAGITTANAGRAVEPIAAGTPWYQNANHELAVVTQPGVPAASPVATVTSLWSSTPVTHSPPAYATTVRLTMPDGSTCSTAVDLADAYLAVHRPLNGVPGYIISHIPTGCSILKCPNWSLAQQAFAQLQALDWQFSDPAAVPGATRQGVMQVRAAFPTLQAPPGPVAGQPAAPTPVVEPPTPAAKQRMAELAACIARARQDVQERATALGAVLLGEGTRLTADDRKNAAALLVWIGAHELDAPTRSMDDVARQTGLDMLDDWATAIGNLVIHAVALARVAQVDAAVVHDTGA